MNKIHWLQLHGPHNDQADDVYIRLDHVAEVWLSEDGYSDHIVMTNGSRFELFREDADFILGRNEKLARIEGSKILIYRTR